MSFSKSKSATASSKTISCAYCKENGHYVRATPDKNSRVTCPLLLTRLTTTNCTYCGENGHTMKYCRPMRIGKLACERDLRRWAREKKLTEQANQSRVKTSKNVFDVLNSDEEVEDEDEVEVEIEDEVIDVEVKTHALNYRSALTTVNTSQAVESSHETVNNLITLTSVKPPKRNWLDDEDSDDEN